MTNPVPLPAYDPTRIEAVVRRAQDPTQTPTPATRLALRAAVAALLPHAIRHRDTLAPGDAARQYVGETIARAHAWQALVSVPAGPLASLAAELLRYARQAPVKLCPTVSHPGAPRH
ncbi:hypothetical protein WEB32_20635 [Streptomyces netropsis]|uniref:Uncharacterized protein YgbK (DUF1537 family) n=1 Tax=Streptomyces netropsis TaxID=55404 RepID=A0A7W7LEK0_STRNE|nr:hypothetical protein [Streptomyces netropsis]MBB4888747.1 uncharacterized protein YgbK (DUF1537 family) [Streptomyces netropsis]GGR14815.1 hypothetical protein GCM10010219_19590 [Streptomyces netropsis]